ncbi:protein SMALL AUXIN UP-REGULATED RNA 51-like [Gastrolobium bilobum]|uniref:protein SMALL AUXIN UP-REGULATED RNA 51-like n=1 Tax=Gastrolobium bilobum TaxID=150636 RepID=UPI002AB17046|nr:protein SMALL AUXIN UP-REGULATED RNA 51-like [Gastrolobium bilobum]
MAKLRVRSTIKKKVEGSILKLIKIIFEKHQKRVLKGRKIISSSYFDDYEGGEDTTTVPEDVKAGHFAVVAEDGEELKRFVVPLRFLTNPTFLRLLEQSAEEYGFDQDGALTIPCSPSELEMLLAQSLSIKSM